MYVKDRMNKNAVVVQENISISKTLQAMKDSNHRRLPVVDAENRPIGIADRHDIESVGSTGFLFTKTRVSDIMYTSFFKVREDVLIEDCALIMKENKAGFLPVVNENGVLSGIITSYDVLKGLMKLMDIRGEGCRAIIKSRDISAISAVMKDAEIQSIVSDGENSVVKFTADNSESVKAALEEKFELLYFKET